MRATYTNDSFTARPLLPTNQTTDFERNFRQLEKAAKRPYSVSKVIRELAAQPPRLSGFEQECHQEIAHLNDDRAIIGRYIPLEALWRRDLTVGGGLPTVQTTVESTPIPFLRYKAVVGRLGGTLLSNLVGGPHLVPRATGTTGAAWETETAPVSSNDASFDSITLSPSRITSTAILSRQLVAQSQVPIEDFLINEMTQAVANEVDRVALAGTGVAPMPTGILSLPVNAPGAYLYNARSPNVLFGGPASWTSVLQFEATIDGGAQVHNDGTYGLAAAPDVRQKWMAVPQVATYPRYLWEPPTDDGDGTIAGRTAISSSQLPTGTIIFGRWSDAIIGTWATEVLVNPFVYATASKLLITLNTLVAITFKYSSAFVTSSDSASQ